MGKSVVKLGQLEFEVETLTGRTETNAVKSAEVELWDFASKRWQYSEETESYQANTIKDRRERAIFNGIYFEVRAIMASDKNGVFESGGELFDIARNSPDDFNKLYDAAIKANPTLKKPEPKDAEIDPN